MAGSRRKWLTGRPAGVRLRRTLSFCSWAFLCIRLSASADVVVRYVVAQRCTSLLVSVVAFACAYMSICARLLFPRSEAPMPTTLRRPGELLEKWCLPRLNRGCRRHEVISATMIQQLPTCVSETCKAHCRNLPGAFQNFGNPLR